MNIQIKSQISDFKYCSHSKTEVLSRKRDFFWCEGLPGLPLLTIWLNYMVKKKKDQPTEERIITAARKVFLSKGLAGARMQDIADEAGINKALLHYYFRSKEKLFDMIFM